MKSMIWSAALIAAAGIAQGQEARAALGRELLELSRATDRGVAAVVANPTRAFRSRLALDARVRGTAFCVSEEGHMLTYSGYVAGRDTVDLLFHKGIRAKADVVGFDLRCGLGVLKLRDLDTLRQRLGHLDVISLADSDGLRAGSTVFSCGNAYDSIAIDGVPALSRGTVTTLGRMKDAGVFGGYAIETDAAVNPGSFGGPLVDLAGQAVGLVIPVYSERRFLGCAVPTNQLRASYRAIVKGEPLRQPFVGVQLEHTGGEAKGGLSVLAVEPGSPAAKAGLQVGDVLTACDGAQLQDPEDLRAQLAQLTPGCPVRLGVQRQGRIHDAGGKGKAERLRVRLTLGAGEPLPGPAIAQRPQPQPKPQPQPQPKQKVRLGVEVKEQGGAVVVVAVEPNSACGRAGIRVDDVIKKLGKVEVKSMNDLANAVGALGSSQRANLTLERNGWSRDVVLDFGGGEQPSASGALPVEKRGYLGVWMTPSGDGGGALLDGVSKDSPAKRAGLEAGDRILMANGKRIGSTNDLVAVLETLGPGSNLILRVQRGDREQPVRIQLGPRPSSAPQPDLDGQSAYLGLRLEPAQGGLKVVEVDPQGPLAGSGIAAGDLIVSFGGATLRKLEDLMAAMNGKNPGDRVELNVSRDGWGKTLTVRLGGR